jgi:general stress protein 26
MSTGSEPTAHLVTEFSDPNATALPWPEVVRVLESSEMFWLSTVRRDGRPHVAPLPAMWLDGKLYFCTGAHEQKAKNIEASPSCVLTTGTNSYRSGRDVVIEGTVARVSDNGVLARLAQMWRDKLDWVFHVGDGVFLDTGSAGVALVFEVTPSKVLAFTKAPYSQTRYIM